MTKLPSYILVTLQFIFIVLLASPLRSFKPDNPLSTIGFCLLILGIALALWAAVSLRLKNLRVMPEPVDNGTLSQQGPYKLIRHPMYSAVIICGLGAFVAHASLYKLVFLLLLIAVLYFKLKREEQLLSKTYPDYPIYMQKTYALVPYVF